MLKDPNNSTERHTVVPVIFFSLSMLFLFCIDNPHRSGPAPKIWDCVIPGGEEPDYSSSIGCEDDFTALASEPLDASIPGATSAKTVIDLADYDSTLYFQNSK
ncbi:MAG: hypothetical protein JXA18_09905, partial [Chitinispirillaceae bacterium]|nr:hypothetical protein [Chitinispirillaceae bacterium]